jgi:hypothetical protein
MRHDYGLQRYKEVDGVSYNLMSGMTDEERKDLWDAMAQIFDNDISPYMEFREWDHYSGLPSVKDYK